jgi:hypothetical protein
MAELNQKPREFNNCPKCKIGKMKPTGFKATEWDKEWKEIKGEGMGAGFACAIVLWVIVIPLTIFGIIVLNLYALFGGLAMFLIGWLIFSWDSAAHKHDIETRSICRDGAVLTLNAACGEDTGIQRND